MSCRAVHENLVHYLYGELEEGEKAFVEGHLSGCRICRNELALLKLTFRALDAWQVQSSPVLVEREPAHLTPGPTYEGVTSVRRPVLEPLISIGCGALWAFISLFLLRGYLSVNTFAPFTHLILGILSGGLFAALCHLALWGYGRALEGRLGLSLMLPARVALLAIGLACLTFYILPIPWLLQKGLAVPFLAFPSRDSALAPSYLLVGGNAALLAFLVAGIALGKRLAHGPRLHTLLAACLYVIVMAPGLAVICIPFSLVIYMSMLGGSLLGGVAGATFGFWAASSIEGGLLASGGGKAQ